MKKMRARAAAGVAGPVVFTGAWIAGSLLQPGHEAASLQISGLAAPDARDPWVMITGFVVLGGCAVAFGTVLRQTHGGAAPWLIEGAGAATIAAGLLRRDHVLLTPPGQAASWHNHAHDVLSAVIYVDLVVAMLALTRRSGMKPAWRRWRPWLLATALATGATLVAFAADTDGPAAATLQRVAVTMPLAAMAAMAARLAWRVRC
jgi:hypothetical membrane protein